MSVSPSPRPSPSSLSPVGLMFGMDTGILPGGPLLGEYPTEVQLVGAVVATLGLTAALGLMDARRRETMH